MNQTLWQHLKWYEYKPNRDRLEIWARSKAPGRITSLRFDFKQPSAWFDPRTRAVGVNPTSVGKTVAGQWRGTRAMIAHEAAHANHTGDLGSGLLHHVANILEDQRIEWLACNADPAVLADMRFKNRWWWKNANSTNAQSDDAQEVLSAALLHRWEWWLARKKRATKIALSAANQTRWDAVRPLVEQAWREAMSDAVVALAKQIIALLGLREDAPLAGTFALIVGADGTSHGTASPQTAAPNEPQSTGKDSADDEPALPDGDAPAGASAGSARVFRADEAPNPNYAASVDEVEPLVRQLAARLERPTPHAGIETNGTRGRYSLRADLRDPDRPLLARTAPRVAPGLAIEIIGDRSTSMNGGGKIRAAQIGALTLHLACERRGIAHAITLFDGMFSVLDYGGDAELASALIAGWQGKTATWELVATIQARAPKLLARPEATKLMIVIHDGAPTQFDHAVAQLRAFERQYAGRIYLVGVYLSDDATEAEQMRALFPRLVHASPRALPGKLGDLVAALR